VRPQQLGGVSLNILESAQRGNALGYFRIISGLAKQSSQAKEAAKLEYRETEIA
jgi:hypothetical protein